MRHLQQTRRTLAVAAIALIVLAAFVALPVAIVVQSITLLPAETVAIAPPERRDTQPQPVALLAVALLRAPPTA